MTGTDLSLVRYDTGPHGTRGIMFVGGVPCWHTLEDPDRLAFGLPKIMKETAIPRGAYRWVKTMSQRFKRVLPLLQEVPQFVGIRIHGGNTMESTEGCILLGQKVGLFYPSRPAFISECQPALEQLLAITPDAGWIAIHDCYLLHTPDISILKARVLEGKVIA